MCIDLDTKREAERLELYTIEKSTLPSAPLTVSSCQVYIHAYAIVCTIRNRVLDYDAEGYSGFHVKGFFRQNHFYKPPAADANEGSRRRGGT